MKKFFILPLFLLFLFSCSNDIDITADYKEIPIVYGLLNPSDSIQFIQVFRGFLDEKTNALTIAQNTDSIYYNEANIQVILKHGQQSTPLQRIDAASIGLPKDAGIFPADPNYVYVFSQPLNQNEVYELQLFNDVKKIDAKAQTSIIHDFQVQLPQPGSQLNLDGNSVDLRFQWYAAKNGRVYQLILRFYYEEWNVNDPTTVQIKFVDWVVFDEVIFDGVACCNTADAGCCNLIGEETEARLFYTFLKGKISAHADIRRRALEEPLELQIYVGGEELYNYISINDAQTGVTSLSIKPQYTNVQNGLGIFSTRYKKVVSGIKMRSRSLDSLSCGFQTKQLNFVNSLCD